MPRVVHFEIPADKPERAVKFYKQAFGWKITVWKGGPPYWLIDTGKEKLGINGAITLRKNLAQTTNTIGVAFYEKAVARIKKAGGKILTGKMAIPGIGYMAYCSDSEGNMFGVLEPDMKAK